MRQLIDANMNFAAQQYKLLMQTTPDTLMPRSYDAAKNILITSDTKWWCSGFYPGSLLYLYEYSKDETIKAEALKRLAVLEKEKYYTGNHDLGFMMYCSFGNAFRIFGDSAYKEVIFLITAPVFKS